MKLIFCGTPQFAVPTLETLVAAKFSIQLVITNSDEPRGRGQAVQPSAVKQAAMRHELPLYQPARLKTDEAREHLSQYHPDAIVIAAYGQIVPQWMIDIPPLGCINLHASILPKYRGAAPVAWAIMGGEAETGVTTMKIDAGLDTGGILLQRREPILPDDTRETLEERLSIMGAELMVETLRGLERGEITPRPQDSSQATMAPRLRKEDGRIDWTRPAPEIARRIRALTPWPSAYTSFRGKMLNISAAEPIPAGEESRIPGSIAVGPDRFAVACGEGTLLVIREVQLQGRKRLSAREFLNGARIMSGETLGS
ncbi:MAG TPA: methionyl-tRNA formyltransferase [Terriglobia bacterium]|nr:methionyl-tRNA formyltransferase [Terriglobia bacterium]